MLFSIEIKLIWRRGALLSFLFSFIICGTGYAQGFNTVFENPYLPDIGGAEGTSIHYYEDTLYVGGIIVQEDERTMGVFLKYSLEGECLDTLLVSAGNDSMSVNIGRVSGPTMTSAGIVTPVLEFVINGAYGNLSGDSLALFSRSGEVLWKTSLHLEMNGQEFFHQVRPCSDGYFIIGSVSDSLGSLSADNVQGLLIRTDLQGNMLWHRKFPQVGEFNNIIVLEDDQVILGGYTWNSSNGAGINVLILKADAQGNEIWRYDYGGDVHDDRRCPIALLPSGEILSFGNVRDQQSSWYNQYFLIQVIEDLGSEGYQVLSSYTSDPYPNNIDVMFQAISTSEGGVVGIGCIPETSGEHPAYCYGFIWKLNQNGDSLWSRTYTYGNDEDWNYHWLNSIVELPDHGFALAGRDEKDSGLTQIWVMRLDSMGCLEPGCHLISGLQEQVIGLDGSITVFANPLPSGQALQLRFQAKGTTTMPYNTEPTRLLLYDLQGRLVYEKRIAPTGSNEGFLLSLNLPALARGTYTLHWISEQGAWYDGEKVVVE
jgi:hypothetical protein